MADLPPLLQMSMEIPSAALAPETDESSGGSKRAEHQTAKKAVRILVKKDVGFHEPSRRERDALLIGFAMHRRVLYGAAFDALRLERPIDLTDPAAIAADMDAITVYEIKSTNRTKMGTDFKGYFFNLTTAELLVAQSLGAQFRFAFVNTLTEEFVDLGLSDVFAKARAIYPAWHIRF